MRKQYRVEVFEQGEWRLLCSHDLPVKQKWVTQYADDYARGMHVRTRVVAPSGREIGRYPKTRR